MGNNIFLTTEEYSYVATTQAQTCGGLVMTLGTNSLSYGNEEGSVDVWTYRMSNNYSSDLESKLINSGAIIATSWLPVGVYVARTPTHFTDCTSEVGMMSYTAEIFRSQGHFVAIVNSNTTNVRGSTTVAQGNTVATSAIVDSIEHNLDVNLGVTSDAELHSMLRKNGAGSLSELLKQVYGSEKKQKAGA